MLAFFKRNQENSTMTTRKINKIRKLALTAALAGALAPAFAGRPLTVDDANVNDLGSGHVEA